jgi:hypothetical protein
VRHHASNPSKLHTTTFFFPFILGFVSFGTFFFSIHDCLHLSHWSVSLLFICCIAFAVSSLHYYHDSFVLSFVVRVSAQHFLVSLHFSFPPALHYCFPYPVHASVLFQVLLFYCCCVVMTSLNSGYALSAINRTRPIPHITTPVRYSYLCIDIFCV